MNPTNRASYLTLITPLDQSVKRERKFHVTSLKGEEGLCRDFHYELEVSTLERLSETEIDLLVGGLTTVEISNSTLDANRNQRVINGMVYKLRELGMSKAPLMPDIWQYRLEISSWLKQLNHARECRIFQKNDNTSIKIIRELLAEFDLRQIENKTRKQYPKRTYVTIYNEDYYHFIIRLLQSEGIIWYFDHSNSGHKLVLCDDMSDLPEIPLVRNAGLDKFIRFCRKDSFIPVDGCQSSDYNYDNQPAKMVGKKGKSGFNYYEYPGHFDEREDGEKKNKILFSSLKSDKCLFEGTSSIRMLEGGKRFKLAAPLLKDLDDRYYVLKNLRISATSDSYTNEFIVLPTNQSFFYSVGERLKKPSIIGNQTAMVTGSSNKANIHTDEQGRVMVRFHWDRHSPPDTGSAFIRNVTPVAGPGRGFVFVPAIDDEVVVSFENGDPDKPLIVGRVYSSKQKLPVSPERTPYQSVIQARSEGGDNRVVFDDKSGEESLSFRAKKNMKIKVGGSLSINVDNDINMSAKNVTMKTEGNFLSGNIISLSLKGINNAAGKKISHATGLAVANIAGGVMDTKNGANDVNLALGKVNTSSGGATISKSPIMLNTTAGDVEYSANNTIQNKGMIVANTGFDLIENTAGENIKQEASLAVLTKSKQERNKIDSTTTTKALLIKDKAETAINDG